MTGQLPLIDERAEPTGRERVLASTIAGWVYPGKGSIDNLRVKERDACLRAARAAFEIAEAAKPSGGAA